MQEGHWPPQYLGSVKPIPTGEGRLSQPITTGTPNVFHLPASLHLEPNYVSPTVSDPLNIPQEIVWISKLKLLISRFCTLDKSEKF